jgi:hypothetical protein
MSESEARRQPALEWAAAAGRRGREGRGCCSAAGWFGVGGASALDRDPIVASAATAWAG